MQGRIQHNIQVVMMLVGSGHADSGLQINWTITSAVLTSFKIMMAVALMS